MQVRVGIVGASGYAGMEATYLLAHHPRVELAFLGGDSWAGSTARERLGLSGPAGDLVYARTAAWEEGLEGCDAVLLATPEEVSRPLAPALARRGLRVIDLSSAYRVPRGEEEEAVYGLPELFRARISGARLVANPGCYPTAILLALCPLLRAGLLEPEGLVVNAVSGVTGAGRRADEPYAFAELDGDVRAYGIFRHRHLPELGRFLSEAAGRPVEIVFTPTLLPIRRGILATAVGRLAPGASAPQVREAYLAAYANEPFVELRASPEEVALRRVVGTNLACIGWAVDGSRFLACAAIDNLGKGAAGQAVQNLNLLFGWDETLGLGELRWFRP